MPPTALDIFTERLRSHVEESVPTVEGSKKKIEQLERKALRLLETSLTRTSAPASANAPR